MVSIVIRKKPGNNSSCMSDIQSGTNHHRYQSLACREGTITISFFSSSLVRKQIFLFELKWLPWGVLTGLAFFISNYSWTRSTYCSCDNQSFLAFWSHKICMPIICFAGPTYFISKDFDNSIFETPVILASCSTIKISSTYNSRMKNLSLGNVLMHTLWFASILVYPWPTMKESNFFYHFLGSCFNRYILFFNLRAMYYLPTSWNSSSWPM